MSFCTQCGAEMREGARFCPSCGASKSGTDATRQGAPTPPPLTPASEAAPPPLPNQKPWQERVFKSGFFLHALARAPICILLFLFVTNWQFNTMATKNDGFSKTNADKSWALNYKNMSKYTFEAPIENPIPGGPTTRTVSANFPLTLGTGPGVPPMTARLRAAFTNGNFNSSFLVWGCAAFLTTGLLGNLLRRGPRGVGNFLGRPVQIFRWISQCRGRDFGALLAGAGLSMILARFFPMNNAGALALGGGGLFLAASPAGRIAARLIFRLVPSPLRSLRSRSKFSLRSAYLVMTGAPLGILLPTILRLPTLGGRNRTTPFNLDDKLGLPASTSILLALILIIIGFLVFILGKKLRRPTATALVCFTLSPWMLLAICLISFLLTGDLLADDGRPEEFSGGNLDEWRRSQGGTEALIHSAAGSTGAGIGPLAPESGKPELLPDESKQKNTVLGVTVQVGEPRFD